MSGTRSAYLRSAEVAVALLDSPEVAAAWDTSSSLPGFTVRGLAGHLAMQVLRVPQLLAGPSPVDRTIGVDDHYARVPWRDAGPDDEFNVAIRRGGEEIGAHGPGPLARETAAVLDDLRRLLPAEPADRAVLVPWTGWSLTLDDFLVTRMLEIVVHCDDLSCSVGGSVPEMPSSVVDPVLAVLTRLAVRRHGQAAVLRAFSRAERAPATIAAI